MKNKKRFNNLKTLWEINPSKPLHRHSIFWAPILVFVPWALTLSYPTWCLCWPNTVEYDEILKTQGFPIFIASLAVPFTVIINRFHSSYQRAESNRLMLKNMTFNQYFEHRSHFFSHLENLNLKTPYANFVIIKEPDLLYKIVFPLNKIDHQDMSAPNEVVTSKIRNYIDEVQSHINLAIKKRANGEDPFQEITPQEFLLKVGRPFGIHIDKNILNHVYGNSGNGCKSMFDLIFRSFLEVVQFAGQFSHERFGGWTPVLAFDPLIKSLPNETLSGFEKYLLDMLINNMKDDEFNDQFSK